LSKPDIHAFITLPFKRSISDHVTYVTLQADRLYRCPSYQVRDILHMFIHGMKDGQTERKTVKRHLTV